MKRIFGVALALFGGLAMAKQSAPVQALDGVWGGPQLRLTMGVYGGEIEMGCASGTMKGPIRLSKTGNFATVGTFEQQQGGPQLVDEDAPTNNAASFRGSVKGDMMNLTILPAGSRVPQTFHLRKGTRSKVIRCL